MSKLSVGQLQNSQHQFLGSGGRGKSCLTKTVFDAVSKVFLNWSGESAKPRVLLLAPPGVAAIKISSNTVHSGLHLPCWGKLLPLNDKRTELRNQYSEDELVIIDKISKVSSKLLHQKCRRLNEILTLEKDN